MKQPDSDGLPRPDDDPYESGVCPVCETRHHMAYDCPPGTQERLERLGRENLLPPRDARGFGAEAMTRAEANALARLVLSDNTPIWWSTLTHVEQALLCTRYLALEAALVDCQPWAHVVEDYAADLGAALVTETPYPTVASMTPRAARNPQIRHADNCPGCIARRALEGDTP